MFNSDFYTTNLKGADRKEKLKDGEGE